MRGEAVYAGDARYAQQPGTVPQDRREATPYVGGHGQVGLGARSGALKTYGSQFSDMELLDELLDRHQEDQLQQRYREYERDRMLDELLRQRQVAVLATTEHAIEQPVEQRRGESLYSHVAPEEPQDAYYSRHSNNHSRSHSRSRSFSPNHIHDHDHDHHHDHDYDHDHDHDHDNHHHGRRHSHGHGHVHLRNGRECEACVQVQANKREFLKKVAERRSASKMPPKTGGRPPFEVPRQARFGDAPPVVTKALRRKSPPRTLPRRAMSRSRSTYSAEDLYGPARPLPKPGTPSGRSIGSNSSGSFAAPSPQNGIRSWTSGPTVVY